MDTIAGTIRRTRGSSLFDQFAPSPQCRPRRDTFVPLGPMQTLVGADPTRGLVGRARPRRVWQRKGGRPRPRLGGRGAPPALTARCSLPRWARISAHP
jgi:hypothetical protein